MNKYNRSFDQQKINESKNRSIDFVMNEINRPKRSFKFRTKYVISMSLTVFLIAFVFVLNTGNGTTTNPGVTLNAASINQISEATYIAGNLLASEVVLNQSLLRQLADGDATEFEGDIDEFNMYFDILKIFLDEDPINVPVVTKYIGDQFQSTITYTVGSELYTFNVNIEGINITGELIVGSIVYQVSGTIIESDDESEVELIARSGDNFIKISYEKEFSDELSTQYKIESQVNGINKEKEIKVTKSDDESKVEIHDNNNEYSLEKELEDTGFVYKLKYKIGEKEGEAEIIEVIINGQKQYTYSIDEDGVQKEINKNEPHKFGHNDEDDEDNEDESSDDEGKSGNNFGG
mgnify:FL=1